MTGAKYNSPISQALAPYIFAGCCTVSGLVPRALFMVTSFYHIYLWCVNGVSLSFRNILG